MPTCFDRPVFAGMDAMFVPSPVVSEGVHWPTVQKRFIDLQGTCTGELNSHTTHIIAGNWIDLCDLFTWRSIEQCISSHGLKVLDVQWVVESITERVALDTDDFDLFEDELPTLHALRDKHDVVFQREF